MVQDFFWRCNAKGYGSQENCILVFIISVLMVVMMKLELETNLIAFTLQGKVPLGLLLVGMTNYQVKE